MIKLRSYCWKGVGQDGGWGQKTGSHQECTVIVSLIGPAISELRDGVCIIRSVNQSNKKAYLFGLSWPLSFLKFFIHLFYFLLTMNKSVIK